jgi:hypothetical protein
MKLATTATRAFVALVLCVLSFSAAAQQPLPLSTGNGLLARADADERNRQGRGFGSDAINGGTFQGFVAGVAWTLDDIDHLTCLPATAILGQIGAVVVQYLRQNPAQLHRASQVLVREALRQAFPCR